MRHCWGALLTCSATIHEEINLINSYQYNLIFQYCRGKIYLMATGLSSKISSNTFGNFCKSLA